MIRRSLSRALFPTRQPAPAPRIELPLTAVDKVLSLYTAALSNGKLDLRECGTGEPPYTDTRSVFVPARLSEFPSTAENFQLYKLAIAHKQVQLECGSLAADERLADGADRLLQEVYDLIVNERVDALLARRYPGLVGFLQAARNDAWAKRPTLRGLSPLQAALEALLQLSLGQDWKGSAGGKVGEAVGQTRRLIEVAVSDGHAGSLAAAEEVSALLHRLSGEHTGTAHVHYRGRIRWERILWARRAQEPLEVPDRELPPEPEPTGREVVLPPSLVVESRRPPAAAPEGRFEPGAGSSVQVSFGSHQPSPMGHEVELTEEDKYGAIMYPEWDYRRQEYRPEWCALRERQVRPGPARYVEEVLARHRGLVSQLRRQFEALRPERRRLRKQTEGDEIDIDAAVEALADRRAHLSGSDKLYIARREPRRDVAVGFLIDLSGSTGTWLERGRIIDLEKESLILLSEALDVLNDRYGIYGFSGTTRKDCDFYKIKEFDEQMEPAVQARLAGLDTFSYTRMGAPIRHLASILSGVDARIRLLLLLSDGRPNDFDAYGGTYGIEDTRRALLECRQGGIRTFCLTIDVTARDYLPRLFGPTSYTILDDVSLLPKKLPELYRRLTGLGE